MNRIKKYLVIATTACLMSGFLYTKSMDYIRSNDLWSLLIENIEALTNDEGIPIDYYDQVRTGTCGVKLMYDKGTPYEHWAVHCYISYDEAMFWISGWEIGTYNWCCDNCSSSTYCGGR